MIQSIEYSGHWSIPGEDNECAGKLTFDPVEGAQLELVGQLQSAIIRTTPLVHGRTSEGWITLVDTRRRNGKHSNVTNTTTSFYEPSFIFVGHSFETEHELTFRSVRFSLFNLLEWLEPNGILENSKENGYVMDYTNPESITFSCYEGCRGSIEFSMTYQRHNDLLNIQVGQRAEIHLQYDEKKKYKDILGDIFMLVRLLTLCTYEQSYPTSIVFDDEDITDEFIESRLKRTISKQIYCYYQNAFYKPSYKQRKWHQHLVLVSKVKDALPSILTTWFSQAKRLSQPVELLLRFFIDQYDFSIERFMDIIKAIELFHRLNYPECVMDRDKFEKWKARFFSTSHSEEERKWLEDKLRYANEPSLKKRINAIVGDYAFSYFDERVPDRKKFCRKAADCRNYYTHFDESLRSKATNGEELFQLSENLKLLLLSAILRSVGIPIDAVEEAMKRLIY